MEQYGVDKAVLVAARIECLTTRTTPGIAWVGFPSLAADGIRNSSLPQADLRIAKTAVQIRISNR